MVHLLNKCPICGEKIYCDDLYQYGIHHQLKRNGEMSKTSRKIDYGSIEASIFYCNNKECGFSTNADWEGESPYNNIRIYLKDGKYYWKDSKEI